MKQILFNTDMVRAILDGRKTQTRRPIKDRDIINNFDIDVDGKPIAYIDQATGDSYPPTAPAPYQVGDILYVRETWIPTAPHFGNGTEPKYYYRADQTPEGERCRKGYGIPWRPSVHMPREAARIFLRVTDVQVERAQDITEEDAMAEGISWFDDACYENNGWSPTFYDPDSGGSPIFRDGFIALWDSLYAVKGYGWDANPWVWKYTFERCESP